MEKLMGQELGLSRSIKWLKVSPIVIVIDLHHPHFHRFFCPSSSIRTSVMEMLILSQTAKTTKTTKTDYFTE